MYGHCILISKTATAALDFLLTIQLDLDMYDFDDAPISDHL